MSSTVCPQCGCRCDVLALSAGCSLGRTSPPDDAPAALIDGQLATVEDAVDRAADLLLRSRYPLVHGLERLTCEAQRAAVALADRIGACVDHGDGRPGRLFPDVGTITCTLGEVMNRADLIVYWGQQSPAAPLPVPPGCRRENLAPVVGTDFAVFWLLRALVRGKPTEPSGGLTAGRPLADWQRLAKRLKRSRYGVLVLSPGLPARVAEAAHALATDLNEFTRFRVVEIPDAGNGVGAEQVLTWQTGYGRAVGLHAGFPRSFGDEYGALRLLGRAETDLSLRLGDASLPEAGAAIATISLSSHIATLPGPPTVAITIAVCAAGRPATAFRFDGLALPLRPAISSSFPDEFQVLQRIEYALRHAAAPG